MPSYLNPTITRAQSDSNQRQRNFARQDAIHRRGLDESLQQFAHRIGGPDAEVDKFRTSWALQGLRFMGAVPLDVPWEKLVPYIGDGARIAPGLPVPTNTAKL